MAREIALAFQRASIGSSRFFINEFDVCVRNANKTEICSAVRTDWGTGNDDVY